MFKVGDKVVIVNTNNYKVDGLVTGNKRKKHEGKILTIDGWYYISNWKKRYLLKETGNTPWSRDYFAKIRRERNEI